MDDSMRTPEKQCFKCKQYLPATLEFFYSHKGARDGLHSRCKSCWKIDRKPRYVAPDGYKHCPRCNQDFPRTVEFFHVNRASPDGLVPHCKRCKHEMQLKTYERAKDREITDRPETMICGRCKVEKPATLQFFGMNPMCRYGLNTICKACTNARSNEIHRMNPEKTRAMWRRNYSRGFLYYRIRYRQERQQILAQQHTFKMRNPEIVREWKHRYAKTPKGLLAHRKSTHNRRAHKVAAQGTYTLQEVEQQCRRQKHKCYYCRKKLVRYHVEHVIPLSRGGRNDISNIVLSCPACNLKKGAKMPHEWPEGNRLL